MGKTKKNLKKGGVRALWMLFRKTVIARKAHHTQVSEMKLAFYAGASAVLNIACEIGDEGYSEEQAVEVLKSLDKETVYFMRKYAEKIKSASK